MHRSWCCSAGSHGGPGQCCGFAHIRRHNAAVEHFREKWNPVFRPKMRQCKDERAHMSALANHAFVKMNGLGNEIVVVDLRVPAGASAQGAVTPAEARAAAKPGGAP